MAKGQKTGGRRKGTPNRVTAEIKAALQLHGDELARRNPHRVGGRRPKG